jgi:heme exporter protein D
MSSIGQFFAMGGYGAFVWSAYGIAAIVIGSLIVTSWRALKARESEAAVLEAARPSRRERRRSGEANDA